MKNSKQPTNFLFVFRSDIYEASYGRSIAETEELAAALGIKILSETTLKVSLTDIDTALLKAYELFYGKSDLYLQEVLPQIRFLYFKVDTLAKAIKERIQIKSVFPCSDEIYIGYTNETKGTHSGS